MLAIFVDAKVLWTGYSKLYKKIISWILPSFHFIYRFCEGTVANYNPQGWSIRCQITWFVILDFLKGFVLIFWSVCFFLVSFPDCVWCWWWRDIKKEHWQFLMKLNHVSLQWVRWPNVVIIFNYMIFRLLILMIYFCRR